MENNKEPGVHHLLVLLEADYAGTPKKKAKINTAPEHERNKKNAPIYKHLFTLALQRIPQQYFKISSRPPR
jgi:hypothetical protein